MNFDFSLPSNLRSWTQELARQYGIRAGERLGQHFLVDRKVLGDIVAAADLAPGRPVLEVGGGLGVLTLALLSTQAQVTVVEFDNRLAVGLRKIAASGSNLKVIERDILKLSDAELQASLGVSAHKFDIVANLPYEISGVFLRRFIGGEFRPAAATLLLQREVAERLVAAPGNLSLLGISCQLRCRPRIIRQVAPGCFWPAPRVSSAVVRLDYYPPHEEPTRLGGVVYERIMWLARIGFAAKRKLLAHNLAAALPLSREQIEKHMQACGLELKARAQELSIKQWVSLSKALNVAD